MLSLSRLRGELFWIVDRLKGSPIRQHYLEIQNVLDNPLSDKSLKIRKQNLSRLLEHAVTNTSFYKSKDGYNSLQDFTVINKNEILKKYQDFKSSVFKDSDLFKVYSSGSTGVPFSILQDNIKRSRNTADAIYFLELAGGILGDKLFFMKLWDQKNQKGRITSWFQNVYAHNVMDSNNKDLEVLAKRIENYKSTKNIIGYPSFFEELCSYLNGLKETREFENVNTIISIAESLKDFEKGLMAKYFNCPVFERYSNQENGILAQQTIKNPNKYILNWASYNFEVLKVDSNEHVNIGEVGRLVVTDLFNYAMPMIRYDTGDMVVYEETESGHPFISSIYGRRMDTIFDIKGKIVSPHIFYMVLDYGEMKQFQFVQVGQKEYKFRINGDKQDVREDMIVTYFKKYLGEEAIISFEYVDEIPLLSSGKRKKIVNEYKKS